MGETRTTWSVLKEYLHWMFQSRYNLTWVLRGWVRLHPLKKNWMLTCKPNKRVVEMDITVDCPVHCHNCNRAVHVAPSKAHMSLEQVAKFVDESLALGWEWKSICLMGGEPLVHPQFFELLDIIKQYKDDYPRTRIELCTSGFGRMVNERLAHVPDWVVVTNTMKTNQVNFFKTFNVAPRDLPEYQKADFSKGCVITEYGISLNHNGYYPCGAGGTVDRVFGFNVGYQSLAEALESSMRDQLKVLCPNCGHFKRSEVRFTEQRLSPTWVEAIRKYSLNDQSSDRFQDESVT